jgi:hypothetical protein
MLELGELLGELDILLDGELLGELDILLLGELDILPEGELLIDEAASWSISR